MRGGDWKAVIRHNGVAACARIAFLRIPLMLPVWALARMGEQAERLCGIVERAFPGLDPVPPEECENIDRKRRA